MLRDIVLPKTVKRIDGRAFCSNSKLKSIKITGEEITMGELVFLAAINWRSSLL